MVSVVGHLGAGYELEAARDDGCSLDVPGAADLAQPIRLHRSNCPRGDARRTLDSCR